MKYDELGTRMKDYEKTHRTFIPKQGYVMLRLDGKAFHSYTRGLARPYDIDFMNDMDATCAYLCENIEGVRFGYVQSDEISLVIPVATLDNPKSELWFDGQLQKVVSVSAGMASAKLSQLRIRFDKIAVFDSRVFVLPDFNELLEYLRFRIFDASKNAITMAASTVKSHKELDRISTRGRAAILEESGFPVDSLPAGFRYGRMLTRELYETEVTFTHKKTLEVHAVLATRSRWVSNAAPNMRDEASIETIRDILFQKNVPVEA